MAAVQDRNDDDALFTIDTRPLDASNRPQDDVIIGLREAISHKARDAAADADARDVEKAEFQKKLREVLPEHIRKEPTSSQEVAVQVASVFGYAMVGALMFHVAWWAITGG